MACEIPTSPAERAKFAAAIKVLKPQDVQPAPNPPAEKPKADDAPDSFTLPNGWRFGRPVNLGPVVNGDDEDADPTLSADGLTMVFLSSRAGGQGDRDLWMCRRGSPDAPFDGPVNLGPKVNSTDREIAPFLSADGLTLFFVSSRPGGIGDNDLWMCKRASGEAPFGEPVNLGPTVNSDAPDGGPLLCRDGLTLLFNSMRDGGQGGHDLWMCKRPSPDAPFGDPVNLGPAVNSEAHDGDPVLSPDGLTLVFNSDRPGGSGNYDLWACTRPGPDAPFGQAVNLGPAVNCEGVDGGPVFSLDGESLLFGSDRPGGSGGLDLWICRRSKPDGGEQWTTLPNGWRIGRPVNLGPAVNSDAQDGLPCVTADGLVLLFCSERGGGLGGWDLWESRRKTTADPWGAPVNPGAPINTEAGDVNPGISADGLTLVFDTRRPASDPPHVWISTRPSRDDRWREPTVLPAPVSSPAGETCPRLSDDGLALVFVSERPGGLGGADIWMSRRRALDAPWDEPANAGPNVNSGGQDCDPWLSPDGLMLLFSSDRPGGHGTNDMWMTTRPKTTDPWGEPVNLGPGVNGQMWEGGPWLSADRRTLYFGSWRGGGHGQGDLWQAPVLPPGAADGPDDDARWGPWEDLFDGKTLAGWRVPDAGDFARHAPVEIKGGAILLGKGDPNTGIARIGACPTSGYELAAEVQRLSGTTSFASMVFPVGSEDCGVSVRGDPAGTVSISRLDDQPGPSHPATFEAGRWYRLRVRVTDADVGVWLDGAQVLHQVRAGHQFSVMNRELSPLGFLSREASGAVRAIRLRRLKPDPAPDDARWGPWEELFDGKTLGGWRVIDQGYEFTKRGRVVPGDGQLVLEKGDPATGVLWTREFPRVDYELSLEAQFRGGIGTMCDVVFPFKTGECKLAVGGWDNTVVCLDRVDGRFDLVSRKMAMQEGRWHRVRLRVTQSAIEAWVDDDKAIDFNPAGHVVSLHTPVQGMKPFGLRSWKTTTTLRNIRLRRLEPKADYALDFDGKTSVVQIPTLKYDGSHPITLEAYITSRKRASGHIVGDSCNTGISLSTNSGGFCGMGVNIDNRWESCETATPVGRAHLAAVLDGREVRVFVNGRLGPSVSLPVGRYTPSPKGFSVGACPSGSWEFDGIIDEVRVSKTARYDKDFTPQKRFEPDKDTLALYHFDEGQGDVLADSSGNSHHGRIAGAKWVRAGENAEGGGRKAEK